MKLAIILALGMLMALPGFAIDLTPRQQELKAKIIQLAQDNTNNVTNRPEVRAEIDALIVELTKNLPPVDEKTWSNYAVGPWKQVWADEQNNGSPEIEQNFDRIYQYVAPTGFAVNLGQRKLPNGQQVTFALKAQGTVSGNVQTTKILQGFFKATPLLSSMSITYLAEDILNERFEIFTPTQLGDFPKGPINAESDLTFSYLDADLKVGTAPNVYTGDSEMFVLTKESIIP